MKKTLYALLISAAMLTACSQTAVPPAEDTDIMTVSAAVTDVSQTSEKGTPVKAAAKENDPSAADISLSAAESEEPASLYTDDEELYDDGDIMQTALVMPEDGDIPDALQDIPDTYPPEDISADIPDEYNDMEVMHLEGYFFRCDNGMDMFISDGAYITGPMVLNGCDTSGFDDGDMIKVDTCAVEESYPMGCTPVGTAVISKADGTLPDSVKDVLADIDGMGYHCSYTP